MAEVSTPAVALRRLRNQSTTGPGHKQPYEQLKVGEASSDIDTEPLTAYQRPIYEAKPVRLNGASSKWTSWLSLGFWQEAWFDVREVPWSWLGRRIAAHVLPPVFATGLIVLLALMSARRSLFTYASVDACTADAKFSLNNINYDPWTKGSIFTVNMILGSTSFAMAKLIDICWDVGVGRGAQGLLAIISYKVATKGLTRIMEASAVHHDTFQAVTMRNGTFTGVTMLIKTCMKPKSPRDRFAIAWVIVASVFILIAPTWLSAMTSYTADIDPMVEDKDGRLVPWADFEPVIYTVHDGARLQGDFTKDSRIEGDFKDDARFTAPMRGDYPNTSPELSTYYWIDTCSYPHGPNDNGTLSFNAGSVMACKWIWSISYYVYNYGLLGNGGGIVDSTNTTFQIPNLSNSSTPVNFDPPLNISLHLAKPMSDDEYTSWDEFPWGAYWQNPEDGQNTFNQSDPQLLDRNSGTLYDFVSMIRAGHCQQGDSGNYQWGFSFFLLYLFIVALLMWTIGTWAFYLDAWLHSHLDASHRDMGLERAAFDLAYALQDKIDLDTSRSMGNRELRALAKTIQYEYADVFPATPIRTRWQQYQLWQRTVTRQDILSWAQYEKWWLLLLFFFVPMSVLGWVSMLGLAWNPWTSFLPGLGVVGVLVVGKNVRGRWSIFALALLVFLVTEAIYVPLTVKRWLKWYEGGFNSPYIRGGVDMDPASLIY